KINGFGFPAYIEWIGKHSKIIFIVFMKLVIMSDDNMVLESEDTDLYEPENIDSYEPENVDLGNPVYSDLDEPGCSDLDEPDGVDLDRSESNDMDSNDNNEDTFQSSTLSQTAFKRIIEGLDIQANVLSNDRLKEILINSEDKILQNLREYAHDSAEISHLRESLQERFLEPTKPIQLAAFFDPRTKDMQIFTENEKQQTISEVHVEYLELATDYYEADNLSDLTSNDIMHIKDIFFNPATNCIQEDSDQDDNNITN
ncbi:16276_t:CDS:2, partial [Racocetra fulgida]